MPEGVKINEHDFTTGECFKYLEAVMMNKNKMETEAKSRKSVAGNRCLCALAKTLRFRGFHINPWS